jgi:Transglutaminase-like superfamily
VSIALTTRAWLELLQVDLIHLRGFRALHRAVSRVPTRPVTPSATAISDVVAAVTSACLWYFRAPMCLERSAAVTRLLRRRGVPAEMVVGCHPAPLKGHAWVEVAGNIVSDHMDGLEYFHVLDRW